MEIGRIHIGDSVDGEIRGYDSGEFIEKIEKQGIVVVISLKSNRVIQREYDLDA
jgi:hypothetical protein